MKGVGGGEGTTTFSKKYAGEPCAPNLRPNGKRKTGQQQPQHQRYGEDDPSDRAGVAGTGEESRYS